MDSRKQEIPEIPSIELLKEELAREESRYGFRKALLSAAGVLVVIAAVAALLALSLIHI